MIKNKKKLAFNLKVNSLNKNYYLNNIIKFIKSFFLDVIKLIGPILVFVLILNFTFVKMPNEVLTKFFFGAILVIIGLKFFLKGIKLSLIPIGEQVGAEIPKKKSTILLLITGFILGFAVTIAEPDVRVLADQIDFVSNGNINKNLLIIAIGLGIGLFLLFSFIRILKNIPIIYVFIFGYLIILILAFFTPKNYIPISFDAGGVTTGPITVPVIMSLGFGLISVLGGKNKLSEAFGLIGIASIGPVITVMILGIIFGK